MKMNVAKIDDKKRIVLGEVVEVTPGSSGNVTTVKLKGHVWNADKAEEIETILPIAFFNNDTVKMADRIAAAGVQKGAILTVEIYENDGHTYGNNFKYQGHWVIPATETAKERNIFMGLVIMTEDPEGRFVRLSIPVKATNGDETEWANITLWNDEGSSVADRAKKVLGERDGKKAKAVVICGENKPHNGNSSYKGFDFILLP